MRYITTVGDKEYAVELLEHDQVSVNGEIYAVDFEPVSGQPVFTLLANNRSFEALLYQDEEEWQVLLTGTLYRVRVEDEREKRLRAAGGMSSVQTGKFTLKAPMPGLVIKILVAQGDAVEAGDVLVILESMKMQNELKAPRAGIVRRILVDECDSVERKASLITIE
jgi:biotin carboxyl carrier protein